MRNRRCNCGKGNLQRRDSGRNDFLQSIVGGYRSGSREAILVTRMVDRVNLGIS